MLERAGCALALLTACATLAAAQVRDFKPVTDQVLLDPDPADWLMLNRTFDQQRFSPLTQIDKSNVGQLRMAWSRGLPAGTQESVPIVYRGVSQASVILDGDGGTAAWGREEDPTTTRTTTPSTPIRTQKSKTILCGCDRFGSRHAPGCIYFGYS